MKKTLIFTALFMATLLPSVSFAQNSTLFGGKEEVKASETVSVPPAELKAEPLSVRKQYVEGQLKNLLGQLNTIYTRTQLAIDRLADKHIDTSLSQAELDKTAIALNNASLNIDAFAAIQVADTGDKTKTAALTATLKDTVKKAEDNLKIARESLIQSLGLLKTSINASISTETE